MNKVLLVVVAGVVIVGGIFAINPTIKSSPNAKCHLRGKLPDQSCTPGSVNPAITQDNINQTICVKGWTATVRPALNYTTPLKIQSIKDYGYNVTDPHRFEEDHLIPLELGGSPLDVKNLWAEPSASPNPKDKVENTLRQRVCSGQESLQAAQTKIANDWTTAL